MAKKYIDADLLRKELERRITDNTFGAKLELIDILAWLDSLQQEQPAKRGYKDCNGCEYNRPLKDQIGWQFRGCFGGDYKGKPIAEIELCPLKVAQQEQPSEDLKGEIREWVNLMVGASFPEQDGDYISEEDYRSVIRQTARHFYELGKQSKK